MHYDTLRDKWQLFTLVEGTPEFLLHSRRLFYFLLLYLFIFIEWHMKQKAVNFNKNKNSPTVTKIKGFLKHKKTKQNT